MNFKTLPADWQILLKSEFEQTYFLKLTQLVHQAYLNSTVYPPANLIFNSFNLCELHNLKVVLIGQDPYHGTGQANGLSFSVNPGIKVPPSLKNIFKELKTDIPDFEIPDSGNLELWAKKGVLLLNAVLTVEHHLPGSHKTFGWELFTDSVIKNLSENKEHLVFLLWGNYAHSKSHLIDSSKHLVLKAAHPSPLARGAFFGSQHFSKTNKYLTDNGLKPINWNLK